MGLSERSERGARESPEGADWLRVKTEAPQARRCERRRRELATVYYILTYILCLIGLRRGGGGFFPSLDFIFGECLGQGPHIREWTLKKCQFHFTAFLRSVKTVFSRYFLGMALF